MATTLLQEEIIADQVTIFLDVDLVEIAGDNGHDASSVKLQPTTRQEANRLSVALRKAQRRIEDIGKTLPDSADGR